MYDAQRLDAVASRLKSYEGQIAALANALDSLRDLADSLAKELASDAAAISACAHVDNIAPAACIVTGSLSTGCLDDVLATQSAATAAGPDPIIEDRLTEQSFQIVEIEDSTGRLDGTEIVVSTADAPLPSATQAALEHITQLAIQAKTVVPPAVEDSTGNAAAMPPAARTRVVDFASRVKSAKATPLQHKVAGAVASILLMVSATAGVHGFMQTDIGQRLLELSTCDADVLHAGRDCSFLGWLLL